MSEDKYPPPNDRWVRMGKNCYILPRDKMTKQEKIEIIRVKGFKTKKIISNTENTEMEKYEGINSSKLKGNDKRIQSCKIVGGGHKKEGHKKEENFNSKYNPECKI